MGPQTRIGCTAELVDEIDLVSVKEAILQSHIPAVAQWSANACKQLPCKAGIRIVKIRASKDVRHFGPCNADAAASKALDAVIVAEVQQRIQHEAERIDFTVDRKHTGYSWTSTRSERWNAWRTSLHTISRCRLVSDFSFQTETAEIIAHNSVKIITSVMIDFECTVVTSDVDRQIFSDHCAALDTNIPLVITSQCRCGERRGGKRHS